MSNASNRVPDSHVKHAKELRERQFAMSPSSSPAHQINGLYHIKRFELLEAESKPVARTSSTPAKSAHNPQPSRAVMLCRKKAPADVEQPSGEFVFVNIWDSSAHEMTDSNITDQRSIKRV
jgi:hypothetical protein